MALWFSGNAQSIGNKPLVSLNRLTAPGHATILANIEDRNPAYLVKCRIDAAMIWEADLSVALEPAASPALTSFRAGQELAHAPHKIQGIGAGFVPDILDLSLVDAIEQVSNE